MTDYNSMTITCQSPEIAKESILTELKDKYNISLFLFLLNQSCNY
ncbi:hypothetical protein LCGC14_0831930 [marine sediment metagenome]|uniref:Uncharacterized protein n=1 Tax=marine sediment metagenome TaxID=412755 RepID=A0A0F9SMV4_9ZZZZ|nr:MAG: hypothetical protein Lokiarch_23780 [Candidatus Lokiarchaeum sp. GC14_75]